MRPGASEIYSQNSSVQTVRDHAYYEKLKAQNANAASQYVKAYHAGEIRRYEAKLTLEREEKRARAKAESLKKYAAAPLEQEKIVESPGVSEASSD